ncbi:hypothetical protein ES319_D04G117400v1 [Gossypium barbadense]|uniref:Uncharacterized protein n=2 Tax=Gossypium TaxID=3633 RepID=A0A5J5RUV0_GOSBA|nr:hypothetical protein ES319_D04G117400v1 [Gossypium barbadense]TYH77044.1 hypothetical protein ES332_D04G127500v1 [Gossypium tomentosum]
MYVRIVFNNERIPTFFTDGVQSLPFPNHVYFIAWLLGLVHHPHHSLLTPFIRFLAAAHHQHHCHEQCAVPRNLLCHCTAC